MNNDALFVEATHPAHQIQTWHWLSIGSHTSLISHMELRTDEGTK